MYRSSGGPPAFDSIVAMEGKFTFRPDHDEVPNIELLMVYYSSTTRRTYGTCEAKATFFSPKTIEAFRAFLDSAEEDFGTVVFGGGVIEPDPYLPNLNQAETSQGLPMNLPSRIPKGLGEG
jgi:hypothetical protein